MTSVLDVATYILDRKGPVTAMKLQKLCYYSQAWSLVWDDEALFRERVEAWANGPVVPALYEQHRGEFEIEPGTIGGNPDALTESERETIDAVLGHYGDKSSQWLSELTHEEEPWENARKGLAPGERGCKPISRAAMAEYYGSL